MIDKPKDVAKRVNVFLPPETLEEVKKNAKIKGMTVSGLIRMIVCEYFLTK